MCELFVRNNARFHAALVPNETSRTSMETLDDWKRDGGGFGVRRDVSLHFLEERKRTRGNYVGNCYALLSKSPLCYLDLSHEKCSGPIFCNSASSVWTTAARCRRCRYWVAGPATAQFGRFVPTLDRDDADDDDDGAAPLDYGVTNRNWGRRLIDDAGDDDLCWCTRPNGTVFLATSRGMDFRTGVGPGMAVVALHDLVK